jgi:preprotein translocase subunit YajC
MIEFAFADLAVAQDQAPSYSATPPVAAGRTSDSAASTTSESSADGGDGGSGSPFGGDFLMILVLVMVAIFGFSMLSQRKQKKKRQEMMSTLSKHDLVQTIGGIVGKVVDVQDDRVVLCVHDSTNSRLTVMRSAVQSTLEPAEQTEQADDDDDDDTDV